jgi:hypothetical protein
VLEAYAYVHLAIPALAANHAASQISLPVLHGATLVYFGVQGTAYATSTCTACHLAYARLAGMASIAMSRLRVPTAALAMACVCSVVAHAQPDHKALIAHRWYALLVYSLYASTTVRVLVYAARLASVSAFLASPDPIVYAVTHVHLIALPEVSASMLRAEARSVYASQGELGQPATSKWKAS